MAPPWVTSRFCWKVIRGAPWVTSRFCWKIIQGPSVSDFTFLLKGHSGPPWVTSHFWWKVIQGPPWVTSQFCWSFEAPREWRHVFAERSFWGPPVSDVTSLPIGHFGPPVSDVTFFLKGYLGCCWRREIFTTPGLVRQTARQSILGPPARA